MRETLLWKCRDILKKKISQDMVLNSRLKSLNIIYQLNVRAKHLFKLKLFNVKSNINKALFYWFEHCMLTYCNVKTNLTISKFVTLEFWIYKIRGLYKIQPCLQLE